MQSSKKWGCCNFSKGYCCLVLGGNCTVPNPMCTQELQPTGCRQKHFSFPEKLGICSLQLFITKTAFSCSTPLCTISYQFFDKMQKIPKQCSVFVKINVRLSEMLSSLTAVIHPSHGCKRCPMCCCKNFQTVLIRVWKPEINQEIVTDNYVCRIPRPPRIK